MLLDLMSLPEVVIVELSFTYLIVFHGIIDEHIASRKQSLIQQYLLI